MVDNHPAHFEGKDAVGHVAEAQAKGLISAAEIHGAEIPGHLSAGADAARETAIVLLAVWLILSSSLLSFYTLFAALAIFSIGWSLWKGGRSAWLAWSRLERMHRIVEQERWEIRHHRKQEKEELTELYRSKGFEGKLLEDVIEVLMADDERLLKVMVEEELCLSLGTHEHPLKQGLGAFAGVSLSALACLSSFWIYPSLGIWIGSVIAIIAAAALSAHYEDNRAIPAICWNLGLAAICWGTTYFLLDYIIG